MSQRNRDMRDVVAEDIAAMHPGQSRRAGMVFNLGGDVESLLARIDDPVPAWRKVKEKVGGVVRDAALLRGILQGNPAAAAIEVMRPRSLADGTREYAIQQGWDNGPYSIGP
jgi:hypothetical protein